MQANEVVVGVDVSQAQLDVAVWPSGENFNVVNDAGGVAQLLARVASLRPHAVVIEASGGPEDLLVSELCAAQVAVAVVNPRQVREFAQPRTPGQDRSPRCLGAGAVWALDAAQ